MSTQGCKVWKEIYQELASRRLGHFHPFTVFVRSQKLKTFSFFRLSICVVVSCRAFGVGKCFNNDITNVSLPSEHNKLFRQPCECWMEVEVVTQLRQVLKFCDKMQKKLRCCCEINKALCFTLSCSWLFLCWHLHDAKTTICVVISFYAGFFTIND